MQQIVAYSITSSARESSVGGTVRPSARAVLRLIASSNLVGCSTGRSAGLVPFRIRSTYQAARSPKANMFGPRAKSPRLGRILPPDAPWVSGSC